MFLTGPAASPRRLGPRARLMIFRLYHARHQPNFGDRRMSKIKWMGCVVAIVLVGLAISGTAIADKGGKGKGGGGGGDDLTNPAFVYGDSYDQTLYLTTADGATTARLTKPPRKGGDRSAVCSPDGARIAFLRASRCQQNLVRPVHHTPGRHGSDVCQGVRRCRPPNPGCE